LDLLFGQIARQIQNHGSDRTPGPNYDTDGILDTIGNIFGQRAQQDGQQFGGYQRGHDYTADDNYNDDYGGNVAPSSQDPWGDPADSNQQGNNAAFGNVRPASEDPFGDPAD